MAITKQVLAGDFEAGIDPLDVVRVELIEPAIEHMNLKTLPFEFVLFPDDKIPTNQRNLTDVRTRMGVLLEYELAKAVNNILSTSNGFGYRLTYVIANRFPDLAFRTEKGGTGVRFEIKAIQTIAEEKSANFDTLVKDIRKGADFVVILVWEWFQDDARGCMYPHIDRVFVMDAYSLAELRDCYWLNRPPKTLGDGRQGFDLCFGVNCRDGNYNREEGNYGKLMRVFDPSYARFLPDELGESQTLQVYYDFSAAVIRLGLQRTIEMLATGLVEAKGGQIEQISDELPFVLRVESNDQHFLFYGDSGMSKKDQVIEALATHKAELALIFNGKFSWAVRDLKWKQQASGSKPAEAADWLQQD